MIGIFDSGIGGATIFKEIIKKIPNQDYIYYSDSKNNPYGDKTKEELFKITNNIIKYLINKDCKIIVIACNTASTIINPFREEYPNIVFIGTEPAYKVVHDKAFDKKTLILATKGTIESEKFNELFNKYNNHQTVLFSCQGLAELIETNNKKAIDEYLERNISKFKGTENVVLGCTHYPLIKENITKVLGHVVFFDSSQGISNELKRKVDLLNLKGNGFITFIDSSNNKEKLKRFNKILDK